MATKFSAIYKKELSNKGILSSLGSSVMKKTRERLDVRNALFGGSGLMSLTGQKIFGKGYNPLGSDLSTRSTTPSPTDTTLNELSSSSERQERLLKVIAKNTLNMNYMARDMNVIRQNVISLTKKIVGKASRGADALFFNSAKRGQLLQEKKATAETATTPTTTSSSTSLFGGIVSGLMGVVGGTGSVIMGVLGSLMAVSPILAIIGLAGAAYAIKQMATHIDFGAIGDKIAEAIGIDTKSPKSVLQQFADKLDKMFNTTAFNDTYKWIDQNIGPGWEAIVRNIKAAVDVMMVYTKAAFMTVSDTFMGLGKVFGFYFNRFFQENKGKIFAAITIGLMGPTALSSLQGAAVAALIASLAAGYGAATGERSMEDLLSDKGDTKKELDALNTRADAAAAKYGGNSENYLNLFEQQRRKQLMRHIEFLDKEMQKKKDAEDAVWKSVYDPNGYNRHLYEETQKVGSNLSPIVSSPFGPRRHPITGEHQFHSGVDSPQPAGTPVYAVDSGRVVMSAYGGTAGNFIEIDHGNGKKTRYLHLQDGSRTVKAGDQVSAGQQIGAVGSTGRSTGNHLHLERIEDGKYVEPTLGDLSSALKIDASKVNRASMENADAHRQAHAPAPASQTTNNVTTVNNGGGNQSAPAAPAYNTSVMELWAKMLPGN